MKMRVYVVCVFNMFLKAAVVSGIMSTTFKVEICAQFIKAEIEDVTIFRFPGNMMLPASVDTCSIWIEASYAALVIEIKLNPSHSTPCGLGLLTSPHEKFEPHDLCLTNNETRAYDSVVLELTLNGENPEFSLTITPTFACGVDDKNVSCCKRVAKRLIADHLAEYIDAKDFAILCDAQHCIERAHMYDGVANCVDCADEVCDVTDVSTVTVPANDGRIHDEAYGIIAVTSALLFVGWGGGEEQYQHLLMIYY